MTQRSSCKHFWQMPIHLHVMLVLIFSYPADSLAESGNYRIEVLLFNHLHPAVEAQQLDEIKSFNEYPALDHRLVSAAPMKLDVMSSMMQDSWRRLRLRPLERADDRIDLANTLVSKLSPANLPQHEY